MTAERRDGQEPTPFHAWVRGHPDLDSVRECLDIGDSDLWVHRYGTRRTKTGTNRNVQYLMLVEVKTHGADLARAQRDTLSMVNDALRTEAMRQHRILGRFVGDHPQNTRVVHSYIAGKRVRLYCYGVHKLRMSSASPATSQWMTWTDAYGTEQYITVDQLVKLLRFDLNPDSLRPLEHREHKRQVEPDPPLFELCEICGGSGPDARVEHRGRVDGWVHHECVDKTEPS